MERNFTQGAEAARTRAQHEAAKGNFPVGARLIFLAFLLTIASGAAALQ